jgi:hypothetical protein
MKEKKEKKKSKKRKRERGKKKGEASPKRKQYQRIQKNSLKINFLIYFQHFNLLAFHK